LVSQQTYTVTGTVRPLGHTHTHTPQTQTHTHIHIYIYGSYQGGSTTARLSRQIRTFCLPRSYPADMAVKYVSTAVSHIR